MDWCLQEIFGERGYRKWRTIARVNNQANANWLCESAQENSIDDDYNYRVVLRPHKKP